MSKLPNPTSSHTETTTISAQEPPQFPNISRFIPEKLHSLWYPKLGIVSFIGGLLVLGIALQTNILIANIYQMKQQNQQTIQIKEEIGYWQGVVQKYPGYGDAYLKLASLEYKLGHTIEAKQDIDKAFIADPNSKEGKVLGAKIHVMFQ